MKQKHVVLVVLGIFIMVMIGFIWGNSLQPAAVSNEISGFARRTINVLFEAIGIDSLTGDSVLRKVAHASEFCLLGAAVSGVFLSMKWKSYSALILTGILVALTDETIQLFVDGRAGLVKDVWIDTAGFLVGCAAVFFASKIRNRQRERQRMRT